MNKIITLAAIVLLVNTLFSAILFADSPVAGVTSFRATGPLGFIENKGQFLDQNQQPRPDLQYMILRNGMKVQLLQNSISFRKFETMMRNTP